MRLRHDYANVSFKENPTANLVLESIGFDQVMAQYLENLIGEDVLNRGIGWEKIQNFVQVRMDSLVASLPEWMRNEKTFQVRNNIEKAEKSFKSVLIGGNKNKGDTEVSSSSSADKLLDEEKRQKITWYHATNSTTAIDIMENGISVSSFFCLGFITSC